MDAIKDTYPWLSFLHNNTSTVGVLHVQHNVTAVSHLSSSGHEVVVGDWDAVRAIVSDDDIAMVEQAYAWLLPFICCITMFFGSLNVAAYWEQRSASFAAYLIFVQFGDGLCAVMLFISGISFFATPLDSFQRRFVQFYLGLYCAKVWRQSAVCLNMLACVERFMAIAFPLRSVSQRRATCWKPVLVGPLVFAVNVVLHVYLLLQYRVEKTDARTTTGGGGEGAWEVTSSELQKRHPNELVLLSVVSDVIIAHAPLVASLVINGGLLLVLRSHRAKLSGMRVARGGGTGGGERGGGGGGGGEGGGEERGETGEGIAATGGSGDDDYQHSCNPHAHTSNGARRAKDEPDEKCQVTETRSGHWENGNSRKKAKRPSSGRQDAQVTKLVLLFTTVFTVLALPSVFSFSVGSIIPQVWGPDGSQRNLYSAFNQVAVLLKHLIEPTQFLLSFTYSRHFRRAVRRLRVVRWCCGCCCNASGVTEEQATTTFSGVSGASTRYSK